jgi:hypothetical protein
MNDHKKADPFIDYHFDYINGGRRPNNLMVYLMGTKGPTILWSI